MLELLPLAAATTPMAPMQDLVLGPAGANYPWGADPAGELFVLVAGKVAHKWIDAHYDRERLELVENIAMLEDGSI